MSEAVQLPKGWVQTTVGAVATTLQYGHTASANDNPGGVCFLRITDIQNGQVDWDSVPSCDIGPEEVPKYLLEPGDIVFARTGATTGKSYLIRQCPSSVFASYLIRLRMSAGVYSPFVQAFFQTNDYWRQIEGGKRGIGQPNVNANVLAKISLPLAPIAEQCRIVARLDELLSDLDAGVAALERARANLKRYRAAVLRAAVTGALTEEWRSAHPDAEPASKLLDSILAERRRKWEAEQLARFKAAGKNPPSDWQKRNIEPPPLDTSGLPELPSGWSWSSLGQCFEVYVGATPSRSEPGYWNGTIPWVSSGQVQFGRVREPKEYITAEGLDNTSTQLNPKGTVLLGMIGEGRTRGQSAILDIDACNNQNCAAIWVSLTPVPPEYVFYWLWSRYDETRRVSAGNNQPALNRTRVEAISIALPPLAEQQIIVSEVEQRLSVIAAAEAQIAANLQRAFRLRQSILKDAFAGKLVSQDPNDEPAAILLERIQQERAALPAHPNGQTRRRKPRTKEERRS